MSVICINCDPAMWKCAEDCPWHPSCLALVGQVWRRDDGWEQIEVDPSPERVRYLEAAGYGLSPKSERPVIGQQSQEESTWES